MHVAAFQAIDAQAIDHNPFAMPVLEEAKLLEPGALKAGRL